jgi:outer membrane protein TolC
MPKVLRVKNQKKITQTMNKRVTILILSLFFTSFLLLSQQVLTLNDCYEKAISNHAMAADNKVYEDMWQKKDMNLESGWLPTLDLNANFVYNSEVIDMSSAFASIPIPGFADNIKSMPHEQYKVTMDINQVIFDGGAIKSARQFEQASLAVNEQQTEAEIYKIKSQVNSCYFNLLLLKRHGELLDNYLLDINKKLQSLSSAVNNGMVLKSDIDVFMSEKIKLEQQISENSIKRSSLLSILSDITGIEISNDEGFVLPVSLTELPIEITRPELKVFDLTKEQLGAGEDILQSKRLPKAIGFATLGYGNPPGNNFFNDSFKPYYVIGAGLKWNIYDWNKVKNEKQVISLQQELVDSRKQDLTVSLQRQMNAKKAEIEALESLITRDPELIALRQRISSTAASQFENGTITASEYLTEVNSEKQAVINSEMHKISVALAKTEYLNICGQEPE